MAGETNDSKMFDSEIKDLCLKILKSMDECENAGLHMDFIFDDYADMPIVLIEMAVNKLIEQGYLKEFKGKNCANNRNDRIIYLSTFTGEMGKDMEN